MSGPKRNQDKLNTIGIVVVGICGAVLVYVTIVALEAFYVNDTSEIQTMADYGGQDTTRESLRAEQLEPDRRVRHEPRPARPRRNEAQAQTYRDPIDIAMKLVVDRAPRSDPGTLVPGGRPLGQGDDAADLRPPEARSRRRRCRRLRRRCGPGSGAADRVQARGRWLGRHLRAGCRLGDPRCAAPARRQPAAPMVRRAGRHRRQRRCGRSRPPAAERRRRQPQSEGPRIRQAMRRSVAHRGRSSVAAMRSCRARRGRPRRRRRDSRRRRRRRTRPAASRSTSTSARTVPLDAAFRTQDGKRGHARRGAARRAAGDPDVQLLRLSDAVQRPAQRPDRGAAQGRRARARRRMPRKGDVAFRVGAQFRIVTIDLEPNETLDKAARRCASATSSGCPRISAPSRAPAGRSWSPRRRATARRSTASPTPSASATRTSRTAPSGRTRRR